MSKRLLIININQSYRTWSSITCPVTSQKSSLESRDSHVKLRIKSFRVPELFTEIPETATVGSLKRTVMEAVTAVLGSGLRVGVLLHGKKVRDDNRTLLQTGIFHDDKLDSLGFTLEPTTVHPPPQCSEDCHSLLPCDSTEPLTRYCKRAKNVFEELKKTPYVVELDLRDISSMDVVGYVEERSF